MSETGAERRRLAEIADRVWARSVAAGFRGPDPYDGLNSRLLAPVLPTSRLLRLAVIQGVKRCPWNLRPLLRVRAGLNPKALALFLSGAAARQSMEGRGPDAAVVAWLGDALLSLASLPDGAPAFGDRTLQSGLATRVGRGEAALPEAVGWGYDFPWQALAFTQRSYHPTVVATSFVIDALADAGSPAAAAMAEAAVRFTLGTLHVHEAPEGVCFSYSPRDHSRVYNASLFAAKLLARSAATGGPEAHARRDLATRAADYVVARQQNDGSWLYGEADHWRWIDNLHTGFVLQTLLFLGNTFGTDRWLPAVSRGMRYYRRALFAPDGTAWYFPGRPYPLDPHSFAQGALTFLAVADDGGGLENAPEADRSFAGRILSRGVELLWNDQRGGFVQQRGPHIRDRTIYLRWSQAWMFRALCAWLAATEGKA